MIGSDTLSRLWMTLRLAPVGGDGAKRDRQLIERVGALLPREPAPHRLDRDARHTLFGSAKLPPCRPILGPRQLMASLTPAAPWHLATVNAVKQHQGGQTAHLPFRSPAAAGRWHATPP